VNKIGPNPTHTPPDNRNPNAGVVTSFRGDRRAVGAESATSTADTVALSPQAVDLNALEQRIKQLPDIDAARVVDLHHRITSGVYSLDSDSIAQKILDLESSIDRS
jgi:flagellar biosynthesis anti-sigma factor FlgM